MDAHRAVLAEQLRRTRDSALTTPTAVHIGAYGQAVMASWVIDAAVSRVTTKIANL